MPMRIVDFDVEAFLRDHWQKRPLLIRNPWNAWTNPLEPDELAGLACEEDVESRLIEKTRASWKLEHGPLRAARFGRLGKTPWTLLVQAVDNHVPTVADLIDPFRFVPNWRIDDIMVSYASDGGGVGPHFDKYDVFLLQGLGQRCWRVGPPCDTSTPLIPHDDLRLIAPFEVIEEWLLEPGDILYVPPGFAHEGIAVGDDCMTYSIGFRAPSRGELISDWCDHLANALSADDRYADPDLRLQDNPGEISASALTRLHAMVTGTLSDTNAFARWFGQFSSTPKYADAILQPGTPMTVTALRALLAQGDPLWHNPASRFAFIRQDTASLLLFVDGQCFECPGETANLAERICAQNPLILADNVVDASQSLALILALINQGSLIFDREE